MQDYFSVLANKLIAGLFDYQPPFAKKIFCTPKSLRMKNVFLLVLATLLSFSSFAQSITADQAYAFDAQLLDVPEDEVHIHILHKTVSIFNYRLHTTLQDDPIKLAPNSYTLLETDATEIGFFRNTRVNNLPIKLRFEPGKNYFLRITRWDGFLWQFDIDELSEREFSMELFANNVEPKPKVIAITDMQAAN
jgi:hypothetical protein